MYVRYMRVVDMKLLRSRMFDRAAHGRCVAAMSRCRTFGCGLQFVARVLAIFGFVDVGGSLGKS